MKKIYSFLFIIFVFFISPALSSAAQTSFTEDIADPLFQPGTGSIMSDFAASQAFYKMQGSSGNFRTFILQEDVLYGINDQFAVTAGLQRVGGKVQNFHFSGKDHYSYKNIWDIGLKFRIIPADCFTFGLQGHYKNVQSEKMAGEDTDGIYGVARLAYSHEIADPFIELTYIRDFKEGDDVARGGISMGVFKDFGNYSGFVNIYRSHITGSSHLISYGIGTMGYYKFTESFAAGLGMETHLKSRNSDEKYSEIDNAITFKFGIKAVF